MARLFWPPWRGPQGERARLDLRPHWPILANLHQWRNSASGSAAPPFDSRNADVNIRLRNETDSSGRVKNMNAQSGCFGWVGKGFLMLAMALCALPVAKAADLPSYPPPAVAAGAVPAISGWTFDVNLYAWAAGLDGRMRTLPPLPAVDVSIGFDQVLKNLDGALMGTAELGYGRFFVFTDLVFSKISPDKTFQVRGVEGEITLDSSEFIGLAAAGYRIIEDPRYSLDLMAGIRGFSMNNTLSLDVRRVSIDYGKRETWFDAVGGFRLNYSIAPQWTATVIALAGAGQSQYEVDVFGGVGYAFNKNWDAFVGFRALKVDYRNDYYIYDVVQYGPILGVHFQF
jgi:hypothetical protein